MDPMVVEKINTYYKIKQAYEKKITNKKANIIKSTLSRADIRKELHDLKSRQKCIGCKEPGGTRFFRTNNHIRAICNSSTVCGLNLDIRVPEYYNIHDIIALADVQENKREITKLKMDSMYGFKEPDVVEAEFTIALSNLNSNVDFKQFYQETLFDIIQDPAAVEHKHNIEKSIAVFTQNIKESNNDTIAQKYVHELQPALKAYHDLFHAHYVDTVDATDTHLLVQEEFTIKDKEIAMGDESEVISWFLR
jgi:hypothetical protein